MGSFARSVQSAVPRSSHHLPVRSQPNPSIQCQYHAGQDGDGRWRRRRNHHQQQRQKMCIDGQLAPFLQNMCIPLLKVCPTRTLLLQLHAHLICTSFIRSPSVSAALLASTALFTLRDMDYARLVFDQISRPTTSHCNAMVRGYCQANLPEKALSFYRDMRRMRVRADPVTATIALKSCTRISSLSLGKQIHGRILQDGLQFDSLLLTALMGLYASSGDGPDSQRVFDEMPTRDAVAWNVLISCYVGNGRARYALLLFEKMQHPPHSVQPDAVTCLLVLQACAKENALDLGERIHRYIDDHGYGGALNLRNSLIAMYSRCGSVDKAFTVFRETPNRSVVTWTAMISGLAMNGYGEDALQAFAKMESEGISPAEQTFTGVLSACSHSGLVDEGMRIFNSMTTEYGISPSIHHYGCVVDLLGRAGLLDEAYGLIVNSMNVEPDPTVWRTLLGACKIHRRFDLGERVIEHLIELKAQEAGDYVLLLNIYASVGNWEKVADVRKLMKDKGIQTSRGCTTIEISGKVHEFIADDVSHPRKVEIYKMLDEIGKQLKMAGYVANMEAELHDSDLEGKEHALSYHSEKLAIAFGILVTPPGTQIRIAKNVRICDDCHTFSKVLSSVYNRVVSIRDRSRFHHFREGCCSCNDYW